MEIRTATDDDHVPVVRLLDAALLAVDGVEERIAADDVLVATAEGTAVGTVVLEPGDSNDRVAGIAVRRRRRDQGIGSALIEAAARRRGRLTARFDEDVVPFYESLGFDVQSADEPGRYRGVFD